MASNTSGAGTNGSKPTTSSAPSAAASINTTGHAPFRPLNVKDALSYLDRVKGTFTDQPEVYDRFLTIMKEFKSQGIDTPGVIERVSSLFRGHPVLIQGFNTFLPPGYRIECSVSTPQDDGAVTTITVTTPLGMTTKTQLSSATIKPGADAPQRAGTQTSSLATSRTGVETAHLQSLPPAPTNFSNQPGSTPVATPGAASLLSSYMGQSATANQSAGDAAIASATSASALGATAGVDAQAADQSGAAKPPMEFNHAINYVNKIKNRFVKDPDTYKAFLEILQTYQKEGRAIQDVYAQVTQLFHGAPDLLDEFKQFLPDTSGEAAQAALPPVAQTTSTGRTLKRPVAATPKFEPMPAKKPKTSKTKVEDKTKQGKRSVKPGDIKKPDAYAEQPGQAAPLPADTIAHGYPQMNPYPQSYPVPGYPLAQPVLPVAFAYEAPPPPPPPKPLLPPKPVASAPDIAFFKRVKAYVIDETTYHEFLKLLNLFSQDLINLTALVNRAYLFLRDEPTLWKEFKEIVGWTEDTPVGDLGKRVEVGGGRRVIENVPALDGSRRAAADDGVWDESCGPSYRRIPEQDRKASCSGRDELCWNVLNDEWVCQPTWLSDEGFVAHRKNPFEEAMHRTEEERHEYDYYIEANLRTIALLEPIATRIAIMEADERATFRLKPGLGNQSKSIYQRVIKKIYGREQGLEVIQALHENPCVAVPIVLARLKQKDDEWKRAVREWNRVWRESDAKNFWKSLDHQGIALKANDKRMLTARSLVTDIEMIRRTQKLKLAGSQISQPVHAQLAYPFNDREVLFDATKLVLSFLDRTTTVPNSEKDRVDAFLRSFLPLLFAISPTDFALEMIPVADDTESVDGVSEAETSVVDDVTEVSSVVGSIAGTSRRGAGKKGAPDLRKKVLKNAGGPGKKGEGRRGKAASSAPSSRGASPAPSTDATETPVTGGGGDVAMTEAMPTVTSLSSLITPDVEAEIAANRDGDAQSYAGASSREASVVGDVDETPASPLLGGATQDDVTTSVAATSDAGTPPAPAAPTAEELAPADGAMALADDTAMPELISPVGSKPNLVDERRQWNTFANSNLYVLVRLFQILYHRLTMLRTSAIAVAAPPPALPITEKHVPSLSLSVTIQQSMPGAPTSALSQQLYQRALGLCESLFDGEIDQSSFEDAMRAMFATQGYMLFTVDKILTGVLKQCQVAISDAKTRDLMDLLRQDRSHPDRSSVQQQMFYRTQAESALGQDENLYRFEWVPESQLLSIQLLGKDVIPVEDLTTCEREWMQYVRKFVLDEPTPSVKPEPGAVPYLSRNSRKIMAQLPEPSRMPDNLTIHANLHSRVCMRSYKLFFVPRTEDFLYRAQPTLPSSNEQDRASRIKRFNAFIEKRKAEMQPLLNETKSDKQRLEETGPTAAETQAADAAAVSGAVETPAADPTEGGSPSEADVKMTDA
ncbi:hypothetical protein OIO90_006073 [Microbotryomycetes sp. JL221]|nr:hypothetical protein OIO90_006073 [Microbotryomycetes sp. JL221]